MNSTKSVRWCIIKKYFDGDVLNTKYLSDTKSLCDTHLGGNGTEGIMVVGAFLCEHLKIQPTFNYPVSYKPAVCIIPTDLSGKQYKFVANIHSFTKNLTVQNCSAHSLIFHQKVTDNLDNSDSMLIGDWKNEVLLYMYKVFLFYFHLLLPLFANIMLHRSQWC